MLTERGPGVGSNQSDSRHSAGEGSPGSLSATNADAAVADLLGFANDNRPRFPMGYSLDDTCGEIGPGELGLMWARSGSGKSTWMMNSIRHSQEVPTVVFNMEMTPRRQIEWLLPMTFDLSTHAKEIENVLRSRSGPEFDEILIALRLMQKRYPHLDFISPETSPSIQDLAMAVDDVEDRTGTRPQRVYVDHLGLLKNARDYDGVVRTAAALKSWAMADDLAVIAIQQTGRAGDISGKNDGHIPVGLSSGIYGGEDAADWIWGMYRPERNPKFHALHHAHIEPKKYEALALELADVQGITVLQLIKNRPYGETRENGIDLRYNAHSRRLYEGSIR